MFEFSPTSLRRTSGPVSSQNREPDGFWRKVQSIFARRRTDGQKSQTLVAYPASQPDEEASGSSQAIIFRLRGDPSMALTYVSENVALYGYDLDAMRASPLFYQSLIHPEDAPRIMDLLAQTAMKWIGPGATEFRLRSKDGDYTPFACRFTPIRDGAGRLLETEWQLTRIDEAGLASGRLNTAAMIDELTGLPNAAAFQDRLACALADAKRGAPCFAILFVDLDRFENITGARGDSADDLLLKSVAERLFDSTRATDLVAYLGGSKFGVLQSNLNDLADAAALASRIRYVLSAPLLLGQTYVTVSIGISTAMFPTQGSEDMRMQAEFALLRAKNEGSNRYCFHNADLDREAHEHIALANDLSHAIECGELELYYQQQVDLATGMIAGVEALIRWNHPTRGLLRPADFLPIVENMPVMATLGQWVLEGACAQMHVWRKAGIAPAKLAMNLSLKQLQTGEKLVVAIRETLTRWSLSPNDLELDVTESMLAHVILHNNHVLDRLRGLGVEIAIDDFATLYSSLDYLKTYRVNRIKIPRSMIDASTNDLEAALMICAILDLAHDWGIDVVAQGVETEAQRALLSGARSSIKAQGFLFSAPVPAAEATKLLSETHVEPDKQLVRVLSTGLREGYYGEGYYR
jgi:diguanylate cyclase (GGDEF)-like protein